MKKEYRLPIWKKLSDKEALQIAIKARRKEKAWFAMFFRPDVVTSITGINRNSYRRFMNFATLGAERTLILKAYYSTVCSLKEPDKVDMKIIQKNLRQALMYLQGLLKNKTKLNAEIQRLINEAPDR